ncbi:MAG: hypothetical protein JWO44_2672 [Bacteroidetes bacterium]|nr:hypothetical protein [Bacteroidota bacterium]
MKKNVLVFGLISALVISGLMILFTIFGAYSHDVAGMLLGYASMLAALAFVFVGIKNYRDNYNNGLISFGKAFKLGLFIALIASTMYVLTWLVIYYFFMPDFMDQYAAHMIQQAQASGAGQAEIEQISAEMAGYKDMYKNPVYVILFTYMEVLPVALLITLISALILKRKAKPVVA